MSYRSLREFVADLERRGDLRRVPFAVDPHLEMTELCRRTLMTDGPALLFEQPTGHATPVLGNLFGARRRITAVLHKDAGPECLRELGRLLAVLREPEWPGNLGAALDSFPAFRKLLHVTPRRIANAPGIT